MLHHLRLQRWTASLAIATTVVAISAASISANAARNTCEGNFNLPRMTSTSVAHGASAAEITAAFSQAYSMVGPIYRPAQCGRNIKQLLLFLQQNGVDIVRPRIIMLTHELRQFAGGPWLKTTIQPAFSRSNERDWTFHVVLRIASPDGGEDLILDLDGRARPTPIRTYFKEMFPEQPKSARWNNLFLREIDASDYLKAFEDFNNEPLPPGMVRDENQVVGNYFVDSANQYPVRSLREYLSANAD